MKIMDDTETIPLTEPFEKGLEILRNKIRSVLHQKWEIENIVLCTNSHWTTTAVLLKMCLNAKMEYLMYHYFSGAIDLPHFIKLPYQNLSSCYQCLALPMEEISNLNGIVQPNKESKILQLEEIFKPYINSSNSLKENMVPVKKLVDLTLEVEWSSKLKSNETKNLHMGCNKNSIQTKTVVPFGVSLNEDVLLVESQNQILPLSIFPNLVKLYCHTVSIKKMVSRIFFSIIWCHFTIFFLLFCRTRRF